jgi:hypothetical protein
LHVATRVGNRLAAVERLQGRQIRGFLVDQIGKFEKQSAAVHGIHVFPGARVQRFASRFHRQIDVSFISLGDLANGLAGRGIDRGKSLVGYGVEPLAADKQRLILDLRRSGSLGFAGGSDSHGESPSLEEVL